ncbi:MAG: fatty acid desaturase [Gammaproteobacteria bacterium]|nr:fatty acid desaturase [Gammaproteobacteria bacterium]
MNLLDLLQDGILGLSGWGKVLVTFAMLQVSMMATTLYLHRDQAHRALDLHPALRHFFRLWMWLTSGMVTRQWVAVHRKHHALCEKPGDPHSPVVFGLKKVLLEGAELYRVAARDPEVVAKYGRGTPDDWLERNVYTRGTWFGIYSMLTIDILLFGVIGITIFAIQMASMPIFSAGVINGLGHARGYRNFESDDAATNLYPFAVLIGGEELHNNHHAFPSSAKFSMRPWEFDIGWLYITIFKALGLAKVRRVAPEPQFAPAPRPVDIETLKAVLVNRMHVLREYSSKVTLPVFRREAAVDETARSVSPRLLVRRPQLLDDNARARLASLLERNQSLRTVHEYRQRLMAVWEEAHVSNETLVRRLREWCAEAEASGIEALQEFSARLRGYLPQPGYAA